MLATFVCITFSIDLNGDIPDRHPEIEKHFPINSLKLAATIHLSLGVVHPDLNTLTW